MPEISNIIGLVAIATLFGSMVFFSVVVAPITFIKLDKDIASKFIRSLFPWYYLFIGLLSFIAAVSLTFNKEHDAILMTIVIIGALIARQLIMPNINKQREIELSGDVTARKKFKLLHRLSAIINFVQMVILLYVLITFYS